MRASLSRLLHRLGAPLLALVGLALSGVVAAPGQAAELHGPEELHAELRRLIQVGRDQVFPALVHIHVVTVRYWDGQEFKGSGVGSGTIISSEGHVLTNHHVTDNGRTFRCTLFDKQEVSCELIGEDPLTDLAVLRLDLEALKDPEAPLPVADFGDSDALEVGDYVLAMGSPFALSQSVTLGIVSNSERVFSRLGWDSDEMELEEGQRTGLFTRWIQHDALINPGNSGGPLVNLEGEIVGVNELGGAALGFAIPSNLARSVAAQLIEHGEVVRSWIGVSLRHLQRTGLERGVLVNSVVEGGPAHVAGIRAGDLLLRFDDEEVNVRFPEEVPILLKKIADLPVGSEVRVVYRRNGTPREATIVTEKLRKDRGEEASFRAWGLVVQEITEKMARDRRLISTAGVLVGGARSGGPAQLAEPRLTEGDVIRAVDGSPIEDMASFIEAYQRTMESDPQPEHVLVEFDRRGKNYLTLVEPRSDELQEPPRELPKAWIGVATQPVVRDLADELGEAGVEGYRITRVYPRTTAAESDLRVGDVITALDGEPVVPRGMEDAGLLARRVRRRRIGETVKLRVYRQGSTQELQVDLERTRLTPEEARRDRNRDFELTVREVTFFDRDENRWGQDVGGVLVDQVEPAGWAGLGGVRPGDLIQRIQEHQVSDLRSYRQAMEKVEANQPERVVMVVLRGARTNFLFLEPEWRPISTEE